MNLAIDDATLDRAREAAKQLKGKLMQRLAGVRRPQFACNCETGHHFESEVVDISFSDGEYADQMGLYRNARCHMRRVGHTDPGDSDYIVGVTEFISGAELHTMFREVFSPIGMPTHHLSAESYLGGAEFQGSGLTARIQSGSPLYVRPTGDLSQSLWLNALISIDRDVHDPDLGLLISCFIDPFEKHYCGTAETCYSYTSMRAWLVFAAREWRLKKMYPIFRIESVGEDCTWALVQTSAGIEFYQP